MRYRIDELAAAAGVTEDDVARQQAAGLLPQPHRDGDEAWYDEAHRDLLARLAELEAEGLAAPAIRRVLAEDPADAALVHALAGPPDDATLSREELAQRAGLPAELLEALEREGLLHPRMVDDAPRYAPDDVETLRAGMSLLEAGVPLDELLGLARRHDAAMRAIAEEAVDLFVRFVRDPIHAEAGSDAEAGERLVAAFREMLPATGTVISHHFRGLLLAAAARRAEADDDAAARQALARARGET